MGKRPLPRTFMGPWTKAYCRVLGGGVLLQARYPCRVVQGSSQQATTRWTATPTSKVNLPHAINSRALSG